MDQFTAHLDRGWDLVNRGDFAGALISAQKSLELDAESPEAHNLLGYVHQAQGRADDALDHYRQAIAIDDTYVEAMLNAAEVMIHSLRDVENGLAMLDDALDLAEGDDEVADALLLKFDALMQQDDRPAA
ncbi:MAG TPA: tetratricopeptide repeat protein, partial [Polyangiales bacterium]